MIQEGTVTSQDTNMASVVLGNKVNRMSEEVERKSGIVCFSTALMISRLVLRGASSKNDFNLVIIQLLENLRFSPSQKNVLDDNVYKTSDLYLVFLHICIYTFYIVVFVFV